jgi:hypothetical protein
MSNPYSRAGAAPLALSLALATSTGLAAPVRAHGAAIGVLSGDVRQVSASRDRVAAIEGDELVVLNADGTVIRRVRHQEDGPAAGRRRRQGPDSDEILASHGIADDDLDDDLAEELLDDEGIDTRVGPARRARGHRTSETAAVGDGARALAMGAGAIWMAGPDGLWRIDGPDGVEAAAATSASATRAGSRQLAFGAVAAADRRLVLAALSGNHLLRSSDGGASWAVLAVLTSPARAVELSADGGDVFVLDDGGVALVAHQRRLPIFTGRAHHLARCGGDLLILADDGLYAWSWDRGVEKRADRLPARRLACSDVVPDRVLAFGAGLRSSADGGRTWVERDDLPAPDIQSAALAPQGIWLGTAQGLYQVPLEAPPPDPPAAAAPPGAAGKPARDGRIDRFMPAEGAGRFNRRPSVWLSLLPRFAVVATIDLIGVRQANSTLWMLLTFPLERPAGSSPPDPLAGDLARRRGSLAAALARLPGAPTDGDEPSAAERRALLEQLEDLR